MIRVLFWLLVIPGGIFTYLVIGVLIYLVSCKLDGTNWRKDMKNANDSEFVNIMLMWPMFLVLVLVSLPVCGVIHIMEKIAEGNDGKSK